jgi:peptide-methionine (S)-S-oxide reductase
VMSEESATLGGGCFWCLEAVFKELRGVGSVQSGYAGGHVTNPSYKQVCSGTTGHAEAVTVWFDPSMLSYDQLLDTFWSIHDPTTKNRQGWDFGSQYRSAIFAHDAEQARQAIASRDGRQEHLTQPIVTEIVEAGPFYPAEDYHQRYFEKHGGAVCATTLR